MLKSHLFHYFKEPTNGLKGHPSLGHARRQTFSKLAMIGIMALTATLGAFWKLHTANQHPLPNQQQLLNPMEELDLKSSLPTTRSRLLGKQPAASRKGYETNDNGVSFFDFSVIHDRRDTYSAAWLQTVASFKEMNLHKIVSQEDAAFLALRQKHRVRMTLDWLDFSVEHLSSWWKRLQVFQQPLVYKTIVAKLIDYVKNGHFHPMPQRDDSPLSKTLAVIAYKAYKAPSSKKNTKDIVEDPALQEQHAWTITKLSLAATIESLRRAGMGRVVIATLEGDTIDMAICQDTLEYLQNKPLPSQIDSHSQSVEITLGYMQVACVYTKRPPVKNDKPVKKKKTTTTTTKKGRKLQETDEATTDTTVTATTSSGGKVNVPKAALLGLKEAIDVWQQPRNATKLPEQLHHQLMWLGTSTLQEEDDGWQFIYYTEQDSILQTRPKALMAIYDQLTQQNNVMVPHRWLLMGHESDVPGSHRHLMLTNKEFPTVVDLQSNNPFDGNDACCDNGPYNRPNARYESCGQHWVNCDFSRRVYKNTNPHKRIRGYPLVRFGQGSQLVSLAGAEWGRACTPMKSPRPGEDAVCQPSHF